MPCPQHEEWDAGSWVVAHEYSVPWSLAGSAAGLRRAVADRTVEPVGQCWQLTFEAPLTSRLRSHLIDGRIGVFTNCLELPTHTGPVSRPSPDSNHGDTWIVSMEPHRAAGLDLSPRVCLSGMERNGPVVRQVVYARQWDRIADPTDCLSCGPHSDWHHLNRYGRRSASADWRL